MSGALEWRGELPAREYSASLRVTPGHTLALVGPNGAGKSTTLDLIGGVIQAPTARLTIGEDVLVDTSRGIFTSAHRRRIAVLGQDPMLFPHLRVQENVEFGPRAQGVARRECRARAARLLEEVDAAQFARRYPHELSGGQAARVALARALAITPRAVLLDEPFAALDVDVAPHLRRVLGEELRAHAVPTIIVTHDLLDVLALADDLAVMDGGSVVECAPSSDILRAPTSAFAASLAGVNHVRGRISEEGVLRAEDGLVVHGLAREAIASGGAAVAVWPPSSVALYVAAPTGSPRNVWPATVSDMVDRGGSIRVSLVHEQTTIHADLSPSAITDLAPTIGMRMHAVVKAQEVDIHPCR